MWVPSVAALADLVGCGEFLVRIDPLATFAFVEYLVGLVYDSFVLFLDLCSKGRWRRSRLNPELGVVGHFKHPQVRKLLSSLAKYVTVGILASI